MSHSNIGECDHAKQCVLCDINEGLHPVPCLEKEGHLKGDAKVVEGRASRYYQANPERKRVAEQSKKED